MIWGDHYVSGRSAFLFGLFCVVVFVAYIWAWAVFQ